MHPSTAAWRMPSACWPPTCAKPRGEVALQLPMPAREVLRADASDTVYYMVLGLRGELIAGDNDLPLPPEDARPTARRGAVPVRPVPR